MRYKLLPILVSIGLAIIPFFWLKPGWIDIGGDSSRLYFYDPINYLKSFPLYVIAPTGTAVLMVGHYFIPFTLPLYIFKSLLGSSYLLLTVFNSFQLVSSFLGIYLITKEFIGKEGGKSQELSTILASTIAGLFYTLSPVLAPNGWDKAMVVHNQFFLNPLIFYLLLRFIHIKKIFYILIVLLISFLFAPNFVPSPQPFSFFPLALFYLVLYALTVLRVSIPFRVILVTVLVFLTLHLFHLIPQGIVFFASEDNAYRQAAFSSVGKYDRGLGYFTAVASTYRFIDNIASLPQGQSPVPVPKVLEPFWFIFPAILIIGFILNKRRKEENSSINNNFLLLGVFFLITLFLVTANVTNIGFEFYKSLFNIPGFSMFRNYYGQFSFVFIFFYALLLGHALFYIFETISKKRKVIIFLCMAIFISISSWNFIKGDMINLVLNKGFEPEVHVPIKMDPTYEKFLSYIRNNPIDGKSLSLPFAEGGSQMVAGLEGGAYQGPSTISYLTGKVDFAGRSGLYPFGELFLKLAYNKDYDALNTLLSFINVKYIFYNSDPYIFGKHLYRIPPYQEMQKYLPIDQASYQLFLEQLAVSKKIDFGDKYHLYEVKDESYLPHIYVAKTLAKFDDSLTDFVLPRFSGEDIREAFIDKNNGLLQEKYPFDTLYLVAKQKSQTVDRFKNRLDTPTISSAIPPEVYPAVFPFLALPAKGFFPNEAIRIYDTYFDKRLYSGEKLILTAENGSNMQEDVFPNYAKSLEAVITDLKQSQDPFIHSFSNEVNLRRILIRHENRFTNAIKNAAISAEDKQKLLLLSDKMFVDLQSKLNLPYTQAITLQYSIDVPEEGTYEVYVKNDEIKKSYQQSLALLIDGKQVLSRNIASQDHWIPFDTVTLAKKANTVLSFSLPFSVDNNALWKILENRESPTATNVLLDGSVAQNYAGNVINAISVWEPNSLYLVSFDYRISEGNTLTLGPWETYRTILESGEDTKKALLQIIGGQLNALNPTSTPNIEIKNLSVVKVSFPEVVLRKKVAPSVKEKAVPRIVFTKINPTKYEIQVKGAKDPYVLIFSDSFNTNWKLFPVESVSKESSMTSYFQGDIQENAAKNVFLDAKTFETWGRKDIAQKTHFIANGYANGWYIVPSDTQGTTDYSLILEMTDQRVSYIYLGISSAAFIVCSGFLVVLLLKNRR